MAILFGLFREKEKVGETSMQSSKSFHFLYNCISYAKIFFFIFYKIVSVMLRTEGKDNGDKF